MIDEKKYIEEMQAGIRAAFDEMAAKHPDVLIYSISIWTDEKAKKSAVSFDTFENSEAKCRSANEALQKMRDEFGSAGIDFKVPPDMKRNDNPADFEFRKVAVIYNTSLDAQLHFDQAAWDILERLLEQIKQWAAIESRRLNLHPDAELGVSGRRTWYGSTVRIRMS